jgi:hypothetical protein
MKEEDSLRENKLTFWSGIFAFYVSLNSTDEHGEEYTALFQTKYNCSIVFM